MSVRQTCLGVLVTVLLPISASACQHLASGFELCSEGTPWADGVWEQGGDSATLYLGEIGYESFTGYLGHDPDKSIAEELADLQELQSEFLVKLIQSDRLAAPGLDIVRLIRLVKMGKTDQVLRVTMIGDFDGKRILMAVTAPPDTPIATLDQLSRDYAGLVRPVAVSGGN